MRYTVFGTPGEVALHYWVQTLGMWAFIIGLFTLLAANQRFRGVTTVPS